MTPKEKAQELVNKFRKYAHGHDDNNRFSPAMEKESGKECAIIAVNEILEELKPFFVFKDVDGVSSLLLEEIFLREHYWKEVKQEIEKL
jgi:hypothetical protein